MKKEKIAIVFGLTALLATTLSSCGGKGKGKLVYDRYPEITDASTDSWLQVDPDDGQVDIKWWVDSTSWDFYHLQELILKRTGVNVKFDHATKDDGTELSTMIAGTMTDVITITDAATRTQLAKEGYAYAIDRLAQRYAPSLLPRISKEQLNFYKESDGHSYGLANNFYNDSDIDEYVESGNQILPNYAILVRKDMLEAYLSHKKSENASFNPDSEATTQEGFIEMAKWVKETYNLDSSNPTVCLTDFPKKASNGSVSSAISALIEYFNVPKENSSGDLLYEYTTPEFKEVIKFVNSLYEERLFSTGNFSWGTSEIITHIKNGRPFAVIGAVQNYSTGFAGYSAMGYNKETKQFSDDHEYVPIVITNSKHQAPLLGDYSGRGLRVSMITKDAKREDRIIKVFDYLMSEQGQRECYYGETEGEYYHFKIRPGEKRKIQVDGKEVERTYQYGQIEWTDKAKELLGRPNSQGWYGAGIKQISLLQNPMYVNLTSVNEAEMDTYQFYVRYNQKCALLPYTYSKLGFKYNVDSENQSTVNKMADIQAKMEEILIKNIPTMILKPSSQLDSLFNSTVNELKNAGLDEWLAYQNAGFKDNKQQMGITYAFPLNDPNYKAPEIKLKGDYETYKKDIPTYISISE
ncbi:MAG: hypothetical protein MJ221_03735 [Bacilli bacterium]|nr:hypothetical protein [Bacilli bacterium]